MPLGEKNFSLGRFPEVGQKQKTEKKKKRAMGITMASYALQTPPWVAYAKPPGLKDVFRLIGYRSKNITLVSVNVQHSLFNPFLS